MECGSRYTLAAFQRIPLAVARGLRFAYRGTTGTAPSQQHRSATREVQASRYNLWHPTQADA